LAPVTLDQADLPEYALPTTLHTFAANRSSLVFTLLVATLAANSRKPGSSSCRRRRHPNGTRKSPASPCKPPPSPPRPWPARRYSAHPKSVTLPAYSCSICASEMQEERCYAASEARFERKTSQ
jgi:hypothetical protein